MLFGIASNFIGFEVNDKPILSSALEQIYQHSSPVDDPASFGEKYGTLGCRSAESSSVKRGCMRNRSNMRVLSRGVNFVFVDEF